ncbi:unnamed protein product [Effrenium voratum]|uniref:Arginine kinase n=1 Tax=Effrenium voratum TaxID=2562239 RepID=A0AA36IWY7_9DINO|nr:unnamed protein product [Effrenium voratum]
MSGDSRDLRLGSLESGFAADGSEKLPDLSEHKNLAAEVLSKVPGLYDRLKDRKTKLGITLARCIKAAVDTPDSPDACLFAGDEDCFEDFAEVFDVVIARMHGLLPPGEVNCTVRPQHPAAQPVKPAGAKLDVSARILHSVQLRAARNIRGFRFCPAMDRNERAEVEMLVAKALRGLAPAVSGVYLPLRQSVSYAPRAGGMDEFEELRLKAAGLHFELPESQPVLASGTCGEWPHGRGVFASSDRKLAVWINHQEHLTLMMVGDDMYQAYRDLQRALQGLGEILRRRKPGQTQAFASSERLGFLTSNLYGLGCSLQASAILKLPRLAAMEVSHPSSAAGSWRSWAGLMRVQVEPVSSLDGHAVEGCFKISNMDTFNVSDAEVLDVVHEVAGRLILAEQQITSLADSDALFPILTSVLSAAKEGRESRQSILSVISGVITDCGDNVAQDVVALLMKEQSRPGTQESIIEEDKEIADLKDRLKCAMYSKLQDGSLEEAIDTASTSGGAMHFSDLPPLPPPPEEMGRAAPWRQRSSSPSRR